MKFKQNSAKFLEIFKKLKNELSLVRISKISANECFQLCHDIKKVHRRLCDNVCLFEDVLKKNTGVRKVYCKIFFNLAKTHMRNELNLRKGGLCIENQGDRSFFKYRQLFIGPNTTSVKKNV